MMVGPAFDLANARILLSNDDGVGAPGLAALERIAHQLAAEVWVVAPEQEQSGASHSLTLRRPLRLYHLAPRRYAVDGTPTDCVLMAVNEILRDQRPTLLLSGINHGGNMGEDVSYSGTVAAAIEGTLLDVPSLALSLATTNGETPQWQTCEAVLPAVIRQVLAAPWPANTLMNINVPNVAAAAVRGIRATAQGRRKLGDNLVSAVDPRGRPYYWIGPNRDEDAGRAGTDINAVSEGHVSVTPIYLDMTHHEALAALRRVFP